MTAVEVAAVAIAGIETRKAGSPAVIQVSANQFMMNNERLNSGRLQAIREGDTVTAEKTDTMVFDGSKLFVLVLAGSIIINKIGTLKLSDDREYITLAGLNPNKILYPNENISTRSILESYRITGCSLNRTINQVLATA